MSDVNYLAVLAGAVVAFILSSVWYIVFDSQRAELSDAEPAGRAPAPWKLAVEFLRSLIVAAVVAGLVANGDIDEPAGGALLGLVLWIAFPVVLLTGSVIWEKVPAKLAAIHGDWLLKLVIVGVLIAAWQ